MRKAECRACRGSQIHEVLDLGSQPLANDLPPLGHSTAVPMEPLRLGVCLDCFLLQLDHELSPARIFSEYTYFSSTSSSWLEHSKKFADLAIEGLSLNSESLVIEVASNDGYLLQFFQERGIQVLGIEPADTAAAVARERGIATIESFLTRDFGEELKSEFRADLLVANNVLAHVPDMQDFVAGLKLLLAPNGVLVIEAPYAGNMIDTLQFDTIYHEHFSYLLLKPILGVFAQEGLEVVDIEWLPTHGGSMRLFVKHAACALEVNHSVTTAVRREGDLGFNSFDKIMSFGPRVAQYRNQIREAVSTLLAQGHSVLGYSAPAKATTLLNYCGITTQELPFTVDASESKQQRVIPGVDIPIYAPEALLGEKPTVIWALAWNLQGEIRTWLQSEDYRSKIFVTQPKISLLTT